MITLDSPVPENNDTIETRALVFGTPDPAEEAQDDDFSRNLAIVIGIKDYDRKKGISPLRTAHKDAEQLAEILREQFQYEVELLVEQVTLQRLRELLTQELPAKKLDRKDRLLVYFAGHGIALDNEEEGDGPRGYLIPEDAHAEDINTFLRMDEFHQALLNLDCRHLLIILDCCFAGTIRWSSTRAIQVMPPIIHKERYRRYIRDRAWQVITSAAHDGSDSAAPCLCLQAAEPTLSAKPRERE